MGSVTRFLSSTYTVTNAWASVGFSFIVPKSGFYEIYTELTPRFTNNNALAGGYIRFTVNNIKVGNITPCKGSVATTFDFYNTLSKTIRKIYLYKGQIVDVEAIYDTNAFTILYSSGNYESSLSLIKE